MTARRSPFLPLALSFGYAFLYLPVLLLILYSFNESRLVTVWAGFSTRWYAELMRNEQILDAAWLSVAVAATSASIATILGGSAGLALGRFGRFHGRAVFAGLLAAPLVMPEVLSGLSLLLFYVALDTVIGWPGQRGFMTIVIAHATFASAFAAVVVQARIRLLDPALEEAAHDLGAPPFRAFLSVTLPGLLPGLAAAWLLAFTLSLDDLVIASFTSGPGATTLPMVIFSSIRLGVSPQINALASLFVVSAAVLVTLSWLLLRRQARARSD